jgi:hypothetical protein
LARALEEGWLEDAECVDAATGSVQPESVREQRLALGVRALAELEP